MCFVNFVYLYIQPHTPFYFPLYHNLKTKIPSNMYLVMNLCRVARMYRESTRILLEKAVMCEGRTCTQSTCSPEQKEVKQTMMYK
jgi:hypothetical protein